MPTFNLSSPWTILYREIEAMFKQDPEVKVLLDEGRKVIKIYVNNAWKAAALCELMEEERHYGNVTVCIQVVPSNETADNDKHEFANPMEIFETAFKNNPTLSYVKGQSQIFDVSYYVVFKNEVVQYFNDDISDVNGNCSTLYQEIAKDIFRKSLKANYCTDTPQNIGKPLGEWP